MIRINTPLNIQRSASTNTRHDAARLLRAGVRLELFNARGILPLFLPPVRNASVASGAVIAFNRTQLRLIRPSDFAANALRRARSTTDTGQAENFWNARQGISPRSGKYLSLSLSLPLFILIRASSIFRRVENRRENYARRSFPRQIFYLVLLVSSSSFVAVSLKFFYIIIRSNTRLTGIDRSNENNKSVECYLNLRAIYSMRKSLFHVECRMKHQVLLLSFTEFSRE